MAGFLSLQMFLVPLVYFVTSSNTAIYAQDARTTLVRGYRTGYSDGYMGGYKDSVEKRARGFQNLREYQKADRAYQTNYGVLEDYRDGYQQGFEKGYQQGFERRSFDSVVPSNLVKRGTNGVQQPTEVSTPTDTSSGQQPNLATPKPTYSNISNRIIIIPAATEFVVKMIDELSSDRSKIGDSFQAQVVSPIELEGAIIDGKVTDVRKPGRIKNRAEIQLSFDRIRISEVRWANYNAALTEVLPMAGNNVKDVDIEGGVRGKSTVKTDAITVGATTGTGAIVGAIAGGPVGAGIGAGVGAAFGIGTVLVSRGKQIQLNKDQQLRLRTAYETQIR